MDKNTLNKIKAEKSLDWQESIELDQALSAQDPLKTLVSGLDDPEPSMAWRSELNQKLVAASAKNKRKALMPWLGGLAAAAACTAAVAFFFINRPGVAIQARSQGSFEAALAKAYDQSAEAVPTDEELAQTYDVTQGL